MSFTPKFVDLVRNFTGVQGSGAASLGAPVSGYSGIADALSAGDQFYYCIQGVDKPQEREVGRGTFQADGKVSRDPIGGQATNFSSGTKTIGLVAAAEWFSKLEGGAGGGASIEVATRAALAASASTRGAAFLRESGREGLFAFVAGNQSANITADPAQGVHIAPSADPTGASGAWVRQFEGAVSVKWFGAKGDGVTNDDAAFQAALRFVTANASAIAIGWGAGELRVPKSNGKYVLTQPLEIATGITISGENATFRGASASILQFTGCAGIRVQRYNTEGESAVSSPTHQAGDASIIRHLTLMGDWVSGNVNNSMHGIQMRAAAHVEHVNIYGFRGDGIHVFAAAGGGAGSEGNANQFSIRNTSVNRCRNGLFVDGPDANAGQVNLCDFSSNRRWGVLDSSFLGNTYVACHADANTLDVDGRAVCSFGGNLYTVVHGAEAGASTNAPSGTTANNAYWSYIGAGAPAAGYGRRAWLSGMTWESGGAYCTDTATAETVLVGCYSESGQPPSQFEYPTAVYGGLHGASIIRRGYGTPYGAWLAASAVDGLNVFRDFKVGKDLSVDGTAVVTGAVSAGSMVTGAMTATGALDSRASTPMFGPTGGSLDFIAQFRSRGAYCLTNYYSNGVLKAEIGTVADTRLVLGNYTPELWLYANGQVVTKVDAGSVILQAGKVLKVGDTQVVGAQGAAVANATDNASAITQLNALLARLRAHGLIAS